MSNQQRPQSHSYQKRSSLRHVAISASISRSLITPASLFPAPSYFVLRSISAAPCAHDDYRHRHRRVATGGPAAELRATRDLPTINVRAHRRVSAVMKDGSAEVRERSAPGGEVEGPIELLLPPHEEIEADGKVRRHRSSGGEGTLLSLSLLWVSCCVHTYPHARR